VIGVYIVTKNMTLDQHTKGRSRLREAGAPESAMKVHACFGEDGQLQVFDVWENQEAFDEFLTFLVPVMEELGIELAQPPTIMPIMDLEQH
jgi:D-mannonate dehydratase